MFVILILLSCYGSYTIHGHQINLFSSCPRVESMDSFDIEKFLGKWYIIQIFSSINKCMTMTYEKIDELKLKVTQQRELFIFNQLKIDHKNSYTGNIEVNPSKHSDMEVKWAANPLKMDFKVVDTDYNTYALIYECQNFFIFSRLSFAILSREKTLEAATIEQAKMKIFEASVDSTNLTPVDQSTCIADSDATFTGTFDERLSPLTRDKKFQVLFRNISENLYPTPKPESRNSTSVAPTLS